MPGDRICLYTHFDNRGRPLACGVRHVASQRSRVYKFYAKGGKRITLFALREQHRVIKRILEQAVLQGLPIVTANWKANLELFELPIEPAIHYGAYDLCWDCTSPADVDFASLETSIGAGLQRLAVAPLRDWQLVLADAAPVYQALQNRGLLLGCLLHYPQWSQQTFSGRSKTTGVNAQGLDGSLAVGNPHGTERDLFIHFDWSAADVNVAAWLSGDERLLATFGTSDPYTYLQDLLGLSRDDCKLELLTALNRLDTTGPIVTRIFPALGRWLARAKAAIAAGGRLETVLGRSFSTKTARNELAVINGVWQGSVAHGIQRVIRRAWERFGANLLVETHDSLTFTCYPVKAAVQTMIAEVAQIMCRPFAGLTLAGGRPGEEFFFPVKVSVGGKYKKWQPKYIYREGGLEHVATQAREGAEEAQTEGGESQLAAQPATASRGTSPCSPEDRRDQAGRGGRWASQANHGSWQGR